MPGLGRSNTPDWDIDGGHLAERCSQFVIMALGESVLESLREPLSLLAFASAFVGSVAMWWIYFDIGAEQGSRSIQQAHDPGRTARVADTYLHLLIVAGIIVCAVADELVLRSPGTSGDWIAAAVLLDGPAVYLLGNALFKKAVNATRLPLSHLIGMGLLALLTLMHARWSIVCLGAATTAVLLVVAIWEMRALRGVRAELEKASAI